MTRRRERTLQQIIQQRRRTSLCKPVSRELGQPSEQLSIARNSETGKAKGVCRGRRVGEVRHGQLGEDGVREVCHLRVSVSRGCFGRKGVLTAANGSKAK